jgi:predicted DNA-binding WGR domain protein
MSTDLYVVKVKKVGKSHVEFRLMIQDAQSGNLPESRAWALMLVGEAFYDAQVANSIGDSLSKKDATNEKALVAKADRFIASVELTGTRKFPIADELGYNEDSLGSSEKTAAWGDYTIRFVDSSWAKGWKVGKSWPSTSYAPPEPNQLVLPPSNEVDDGRMSFYFVEPTLPQAQINALVQRCGGRVAKEIFMGLSYVVYPNGFNMKHPSIRLAQQVGGRSGLSIMSEPDFLEYIDDHWPEPAAKKKASPSKAPGSAAAASTQATGNKQRFEFVEGASSKYWEVWLEGNAVHTHYGRIGTAGQTTIKTVGSAADAEKLSKKLVTEKTKKGYVEK